MWQYISSLLGGEREAKHPKPELKPPSVAITGARFPADGSRPHLIALKTMPADGGVDCYLFHVPDLRSHWNDERAWRMRDTERFTLKEQMFGQCDGVYIVWYTAFPFEAMENRTFRFPFKTPYTPRGDVFVAKLQPQEYGEHAWATYDDVSEEFFQLPVVTRGTRQGVFGAYGQKIDWYSIW